MNDLEQKKNAKEFSERWKDKGYEKGESQKFWIELLEQVLGMNNASQFIDFEDQVHIDKSTGFIDGFIKSTKVMIEQKSIDKDLRKPIKQSDGSLLNPFQQAKRYSAERPYDLRPRWIVTCNFKSFLVYDMNNPNGEPEEILLKNLSKEYYRLSFLIDSKNEHIKKEEELSFKAGELVGKLYDAFFKEYKDINKEQSKMDLNELCVRVVFCLYAEDAGLFGKKNIFHDYLSKYDDLVLMRENLIKLFKILDTKVEDRDPYLEEELNQFPYVNGGLFSNENIEIPKFNEDIRNILLAKASDDFDWSEISPTIFGAVFESTLNPETRRSGGMHYTSIENIHKVIDPLFLNELRDKLNEAEAYKNEKTRNEKLLEFQNYISSLNFFDPACGSGNFLTETYLSLRRLENEVLSIMSKGMMMMDIGGLIKVSIQQFYGIEINDFAVKVAKTALWIAEAQMWSETKKIISSYTSIADFLPLESYDNIVEGNALRIDWNEVLPNIKCNYIMGNPPFVGTKVMSDSQKDDTKNILGNLEKYGTLDYVACWYMLSANYIYNTNIQCALVSTNSITQGEQVYCLWKPLLENKKIVIDFAYNTFIWDSEASIKAHVHCVIIGFSHLNNKSEKVLYNDNKFKKVNNINGYLVDAPNVFITNRKQPICDVPPIFNGCKFLDDGNYVFSREEKDELIKKDPNASVFIRKYYGAENFINNKELYCLWLKNAEPSDLKKSPATLQKIEKVRNFRLGCKSPDTQSYADRPTLPTRMAYYSNNEEVDVLIIPIVSSERRRYLPIGYMDKNAIVSYANMIMPNASLFSFGIIESNVHSAWLRTVCGRLKSDYRYSNTIVYNNFPWPKPTDEQKEKIEKTAQAILDARKLYPNSSLADLYDELTMSPELRKAHQSNDKAVMEAYGFNIKITESECVAKLMEMYQKLISNNNLQSD